MYVSNSKMSHIEVDGQILEPDVVNPEYFLEWIDYCVIVLLAIFLRKVYKLLS